MLSKLIKKHNESVPPPFPGIWLDPVPKSVYFCNMYRCFGKAQSKHFHLLHSEMYLQLQSIWSLHKMMCSLSTKSCGFHMQSSEKLHIILVAEIQLQHFPQRLVTFSLKSLK